MRGVHTCWTTVWLLKGHGSVIRPEGPCTDTSPTHPSKGGNGNLAYCGGRLLGYRHRKLRCEGGGEVCHEIAAVYSVLSGGFWRRAACKTFHVSRDNCRCGCKKELSMYPYGASSSWLPASRCLGYSVWILRSFLAEETMHF